MKGEQAWALEDYLEVHPNGCEVSFNAGWIACEKYYKTKKGFSVSQQLGEDNIRWDDEVTQKYATACELVLKGYSKAEACRMTKLSYDSFMRRQRMAIYGKDRIR